MDFIIKTIVEILLSCNPGLYLDIDFEWKRGAIHCCRRRIEEEKDDEGEKRLPTLKCDYKSLPFLSHLFIRELDFFYPNCRLRKMFFFLLHAHNWQKVPTFNL